MRPLPAVVEGVKVQPSGDPLEVRGQVWQILVPVDYEGDGRVWEFSRTTGRLILTVRG